MFWTDWGHIPKIERATLSGTQRVSIVTSNLVWPFAIDLDRRSRLVFWVDRWLGRVESVDYHGNNRRILFQQKGVSFYGVTFFSFNLFTSASDWRTFWIYKLKANANGTFVSNINFKNISKQLFGLVSYDSFTQLPALGVPCKSPCFLVATPQEIKALDYNSATTYPIISNLTRVGAIDVHFNLGYIFWSDVTEGNIKRANIDGTNITLLHNGIESDGLAVDWMSSQLYWTDRKGAISISDLEGNNRRILHSSKKWRATYRGIVLDPERK
ncbi:low-density lipoprotein receptor-related protein 6-like [Orbicella faveolata]|uniref:low-density lipoprotein receptor-related protein 6-like n=1 Tax=Orbicella faveolata TaxID=48498 RepID=UPI0009E29EBC|nr:low-density lipoprotein receptor-related protein 6-like [Orbicella faveolata]